MSDLGSEIADRALSEGGQQVSRVIESILNLAYKIYKGMEKVPAKVLIKSETKLSVLGINMNRSDMKSFEELLKKQSINIACLVNENNILNQKKYFHEVICDNKDLEATINIINRLNDEKQIAAIDSRIDEIIGVDKKDLTKQDKVDLDVLYEKREMIQINYCNKFNVEQIEKIIQQPNDIKQLNFKDAFNNTGGYLDKNINSILADAKNPKTYILCCGNKDVYKEKVYIKTNYDVYKDGKKILTVDDGRFDNRPLKYWENQIVKIKDVGGFGDTLFKFYSVENYESWAKIVSAKNTNELKNFENNSNRKDYRPLIKELENQLDQRGAVIKDGIVIDKLTKEEIIINKKESQQQQVFNAEKIIISDQIKNYKEINKLKGEVGIAKSEVITTEEGTNEREKSQINFNKINDQYMLEKNKEKILIDYRKSINGAKVKLEGIKEKEVDKTDISIDKQNNKKLDLKGVKEKIQKERNSELNISKVKGAINEKQGIPKLKEK